MLYDVSNETMPREELEALQLGRLKAMVEKVYYNVPFYQNRFNEMGIRPEQIRSLDDLKYLPFTENHRKLVLIRHRNVRPVGEFQLWVGWHTDCYRLCRRKAHTDCGTAPFWSDWPG